MTLESASPATEQRAWRTALGVVLAATALRLVLAAILPLFPDEAYYWEWSRRLAGGYFDHPPMIALLIRAGGFRTIPLLIRLGPVLAGGLATLAATAIARRLAGGRAGLVASLAFVLMPLAAAGLVLATPDAPLLGATACALYAVVRALQSPIRSRASFGWWCVAGVALGAAFASKYTSILLPLTLVVAVVVRPSLRARLREPGPYVACVLATLVFLPVLQWNAAHDWVSFRFQLSHGLGTPPKGSALERELDLIGGQLGLVSPILFLMMAHAVWRALRRPVDDAHFALAVVATGSWAFFVYSALRRSVEPNWPAPSYVPGIALLASLVVRRMASAKWMRYGTALAGALVAVIYVHALHPILPIPARRDPIARSAGWGGLASRMEDAQTAMGGARRPGDASLRGGGRSWLAADRYQDVAEIAAHLVVGVPPVVFCTCLTGRRNQYELWPGFAQSAREGDALVIALDDTPGMHETAARLAPYFTRVTRDSVVPLLRGRDTVGVRRLYVLEGYRGGWPPRAER